MTNVVNLGNEEVDLQGEVIDMLERALVRAKAGDMKGAALAWVGSDGAICSNWSAKTCVPEVGYAIAMMHNSFFGSNNQ